MANPVADIRSSPAWATWPAQWTRGAAGALRTRGDKGLQTVVHNIASMQKALAHDDAARRDVAERLRVVQGLALPRD